MNLDQQTNAFTTGNIADGIMTLQPEGRLSFLVAILTIVTLRTCRDINQAQLFMNAMGMQLNHNVQTALHTPFKPEGVPIQ